MPPLSIALAVVAGIVLALAPSSALAAPPANDDFSSAAALVGDVYRAEINTTEATAAAIDAEVTASCNLAGPPEASVWFSVSSSSEASRYFEVVADHSVQVAFVVEQLDGSLASYCIDDNGAGVVALSFWTSRPLYLMVFDDVPGGANGGMLHVFSRDLSTPPLANVSVSATGTFEPRTGTVTLNGTFTCENAQSVTLYLTVSQTVGAHTFSAGGAYELTTSGLCDGQSHPWTAAVESGRAGRFVGTSVDVTASWCAADEFACEWGDLPTRSVTLVRDVT